MKLTPKMQVAVQVLCAGATQAEAAKACGVGLRTIQEWTAAGHPVRAQLDDVQTHLRKSVTSQIAEKVSAMIDELVRIGLEGDKESDRIRAIQHALGIFGITPVSQSELTVSGGAPADVHELRQRALAIIEATNDQVHLLEGGDE